MDGPQPIESKSQPIALFVYCQSSLVRGLNRQSAIGNRQCFSVSTKKLLNVRIAGLSQRLIRTTENYVSLAHHQNFAVDQTETLALSLEDYLARFIHHGVFRTEIVQVVHFVCDEN